MSRPRSISRRSGRITCAWQRVIAHSESIEPEPSYLNSRIDAFGNDVLYFSLESPHERCK